MGTTPAAAPATSKKADALVEALKLAYAILLVCVCIYGHYHDWLQPVCLALVAGVTLYVLGTSGRRLLKP